MLETIHCVQKRSGSFKNFIDKMSSQITYIYIYIYIYIYKQDLALNNLQYFQCH